MTGGHTQTLQGMECHTEQGPLGRSLAGIGVDIVVMAVVRIAQIKNMERFRDVLQKARRNSEALTEMFRKNVIKSFNGGGLILNKDGGLWAWKVVEELGWANRYGEILKQGDLVSGVEVISKARSFLYRLIREGGIIRDSSDYSGFDHVHAFDLLNGTDKDEVDSSYDRKREENKESDDWYRLPR